MAASAPVEWMKGLQSHGLYESQDPLLEAVLNVLFQGLVQCWSTGKPTFWSCREPERPPPAKGASRLDQRSSFKGKVAKA